MGNRSNPRLNILFYIIILVFALLISRLGFLQIAQGAQYRIRADNNRIRLMPLTAPRGLFYDRNMVSLVTNRPGFTVSLMPISGPISDDVINRLASYVGMTPDDIREKIKQKDNPLEPIRIKNNVDQEIISKIEEHRSQLPDVVLEVQAVRDYIYHDLAAHLFGYVGEISENELKNMKVKGYKDIDIIGKFGLEQVWDKEIRGVDGGTQEEIDAGGRSVRMLGTKPPVLGNSLVLTIDANVQKAAEKAIDEQLAYVQNQMGFADAKAGAVVAMNPQTGEILAMVSRPTFDPNLFNGGISEKNWNEINNNPHDPMENRTLEGEYPPGSTFKVVTGTAALELGKVTPEEKILDNGHYMGKQNAMGEALGWLDFKTALAKSDDVFFYQMGERVGIDNLTKYSHMFGLGTPTGINLGGESSGLVASQEYKEKVYHEPWYLSETLDAAIGQGFNLITPLQEAVLYSELANGGIRYRPYVVSKILSPDGDTVRTFEPEEMGRVQISSRNLDLVRQGLHDVALPGGTAGYVFQGFPVPIAGKTGTAENSQGDDNGLFLCYAPYDHPTIVVAVIIEHGGFGTDCAAPIARRILEAYFNISHQKDSTDTFVEAETAKIVR
jgi:penicillin-binding protein 2